MTSDTPPPPPPPPSLAFIFPDSTLPGRPLTTVPVSERGVGAR